MTTVRMAKLRPIGYIGEMKKEEKKRASSSSSTFEEESELSNGGTDEGMVITYSKNIEYGPTG